MHGLGIDDIGVLAFENIGKKLRYIRPYVLFSGSSNQTSWLQQRKLSEQVLKNAIASNEVIDFSSDGN